MTLAEALKDIQRSKIFIVACKNIYLKPKLEWIKGVYGDVLMKDLVR